MTQAITGVLKKGQIRAAEPCRIGAAAQTGAAPAAGAAVRIAQQHADHAVLEVRCACGRITHVECRWSVPAPANGHDAPTTDAEDRSDDTNKEVT